MITVIYWPLLFERTFSTRKTWASKVSLVLDHFLPLLLLLIEYFALSNPIFLKRHAYVVVTLLIIYTPINMGYSLFDQAPYAIMDWKTIDSLFIGIGFFLGFFIIFFSLEWLTSSSCRSFQ